ADFSNDFANAIPLMKRAIEIDPDFALAHALLGLMYSGNGQSVLSAESTSKAFDLRQRASDRERFFIMTTYHRQVTGNLKKEQETLKLWAETYPRDADAPGILGGFATQGSGQYEESIEASRRALTIDPDSVPPLLNLAWANLFLDRVPEA